MSQWLNEAITNQSIHSPSSSTMVSFAEFYKGVREHFSKNPTSYEQFKNAKTGWNKVEYLLQHPIVQTSLKNLQTKNKIKQLDVANRNSLNRVVETDTNGNEGKDAFDMISQCNVKITGKGSRRYPQMSNKVDVKMSSKKGRYLVAKEKINPGKFTLNISNHSQSHCVYNLSSFDPQL